MTTKYAIVKAFGQQFKVREGDKIRTNKVEADVGSKVSLSEVLMLSDNGQIKVGAPVVSGATVHATVEAHVRADKILVFKYLRKNKHKKTYGHRQPHTVLTIQKIEG